MSAGIRALTSKTEGVGTWLCTMAHSPANVKPRNNQEMLAYRITINAPITQACQIRRVIQVLMKHLWNDTLHKS